MVDRTSVKYEEIRRKIDENFNNYDRFGCRSARNRIRRLLKEHSKLRKEYSGLSLKL